MRIYPALILIWVALFLTFFNVNANPFAVFLGCSGNDVRKGFSDHFYTALSQQGISTFREDDGIPVGENSALVIKRAFYGSKLAVVIFSNEYAKSTKCLDELEMIMERRERDEYLVVPVYVNIDRSVVGEQTGTYVEVFADLERRLEGKIDKVERWRKVLKDVADVHGWSLNNGYESPFIKKIVEDIKDKLNSTVPNPAPYFNWKTLLLIILLVSVQLLKMVVKRFDSLIWQCYQLIMKRMYHIKVPGEGDHGDVLQGDGNGRNMDATS